MQREGWTQKTPTKAIAQGILSRMVRSFGLEETIRMTEAADRELGESHRQADGEVRKFLETRMGRGNSIELTCRPESQADRPAGYT